MLAGRFRSLSAPLSAVISDVKAESSPRSANRCPVTITSAAPDRVSYITGRDRCRMPSTETSPASPPGRLSAGRAGAGRAALCHLPGTKRPPLSQAGGFSRMLATGRLTDDPRRPSALAQPGPHGSRTRRSGPILQTPLLRAV